MSFNPIKTLIETELNNYSEILDYSWLNLDEEDLEGFENLKDKVDTGKFGEMTFMKDSLEMRAKPQNMETWARCVLMVSIKYPIELTKHSNDLDGNPKVASYANGVDYHYNLKKILTSSITTIENTIDDKFQSRIFVDSAPIREQVLARKSGLGWTGKNTLQINQKLGSSFCLGGILFDFEIENPGKPTQDFCGGCTLCIQACPTDALNNPWELEANKCLSYFTIETRNPIPEEYWANQENWLFGCDICQQVCPWNHKQILKASSVTSISSRFNQSIEDWLLVLRKGGGFKSTFKSTPLQRAGRPKLLSNLFSLAYTSKRYDLVPILNEIACEETGKWKDHMLKIIKKMQNENV
jgi:epoxyqueuosine reductase